MSGLIVGLVLRHPISDTFNTEAKFVATVYADHAWEDGTHAHPAVETVARITGLHERTIQRYLRLLEKMGMLIPSGKGPRGTNQYSFPLENGADGSVRLAISGGDSLPPRQPARGDRESGDRESGDTAVSPKQTTQDLLVVVNADAANISTELNARVFTKFEQEFGALTPTISDMVNDDIKTYTAEWVLEAMDIAVEANARRWSYVRGILKRCAENKKRPSLNRLEKPHANGNTSNPKRPSAKRSAPARTPAYTDADRAAADAINALS